jgi:DNA-binding response OmpR family regulator
MQNRTVSFQTTNIIGGGAEIQVIYAIYCKLRRRLEPDPRIRIVNVRGEGYKLLVNE